MIKFFRKIRQNMIKENKVSKYMLYAIGEIVLVVIGIFIALQLNTWKENNKNFNESKLFTIRLLDEIKSNILITNLEIEREKSQIKSLEQILNMFGKDYKNVNSRTLDSLIYVALGSNSIDINLGTITEGLNTGKISLIQSDTLRTSLYSFPTLIDEIITSEKASLTDASSNFSPFLYNNFNYRQMDAVFSPYKKQIGISKFSDYNNLKILASQKFENLIDNRYFNSRRQLEAYEKLLKELNYLKTLIERELQID